MAEAMAGAGVRSSSGILPVVQAMAGLGWSPPTVSDVTHQCKNRCKCIGKNICTYCAACADLTDRQTLRGRGPRSTAVRSNSGSCSTASSPASAPPDGSPCSVRHRYPVECPIAICRHASTVPIPAARSCQYSASRSTQCLPLHTVPPAPPASYALFEPSHSSISRCCGDYWNPGGTKGPVISPNRHPDSPPPREHPSGWAHRGSPRLLGRVPELPGRVSGPVSGRVSVKLRRGSPRLLGQSPELPE